MSPRTYTVHRKDGNHDELLAVAKRCGATVFKHPPLDVWVWVAKWQMWMPVEIKRPEREGRKDEYTSAQQRFMAMGVRWWTWRTEEDVIRDLAGRG